MQVVIDGVLYEVRIDWYGKTGYATPHLNGIPLGLPIRCRSIAQARAKAEERIREFRP